MIYIQVDNPESRFERLLQRGEARDPQNHEDFLAQEKTEKDFFQLDEAIQQADITISNSGTKEEFHREIDQLISQHQFFRGLDCQT